MAPKRDKWIGRATHPLFATASISPRLFSKVVSSHRESQTPQEGSATHHQLLPSVARIGHYTGVQRTSTGF